MLKVAAKCRLVFALWEKMHTQLFLHTLQVRCFGTFQDPRYLYLVMELVQGSPLL